MSYRSESTGRELGITPVRGVRAFAVDEDGTLRGATGHAWVPGENVAECLDWKAFGSAFGEGWLAPLRLLLARSREVGAGVHDEASCHCGFYAYHDGVSDFPVPSADAVSTARVVHAVVEGYGRTTIGPRGFRSSRARIVALAAPAEARSARVRRESARARRAEVHERALESSRRDGLSGALGRLELRIESRVERARERRRAGVVPSTLLFTPEPASTSRSYLLTNAARGARWGLSHLHVLALFPVARLVNARHGVAAGRAFEAELRDSGRGLDVELAAALRERYPGVPVLASVSELIETYPPDAGGSR